MNKITTKPRVIKGMEKLKNWLFRLNLNLQETLYIVDGSIVLATHEGNSTAFKSHAYDYADPFKQDVLDEIVDRYDNVVNIGHEGYSLSVWMGEGLENIGKIGYDIKKGNNND